MKLRNSQSRSVAVELRLSQIIKAPFTITQHQTQKWDLKLRLMLKDYLKNEVCLLSKKSNENISLLKTQQVTSLLPTIHLTLGQSLSAHQPKIPLTCFHILNLNLLSQMFT